MDLDSFVHLRTSTSGNRCVRRRTVEADEAGERERRRQPRRHARFWKGSTDNEAEIRDPGARRHDGPVDAAPHEAAQALTPINVSYQPSLYWALPFHYRHRRRAGGRRSASRRPSQTFPAGAPQVAAAQAKSWDVGGTGSVPAVLGAARFGLLTIGLTNDESKANAMMVRGDKFDAIQGRSRAACSRASASWSRRTRPPITRRAAA